jgi:ribosomal protein L37AE/L43A
VAEREHENIKDRIRAGHKARLRSGKYLGHTALNKPYGYDIVDGILVVNPTESKVVDYIYKCYNGKNKSTQQIADNLNDRGIPSATGKKWRHSAINKVLSKSYYSTGIFKIGKKLGEFELAVPTIISKQAFKKAQEKKILRKASCRRNSKNNYWFRGIAFCEKCGYQLFGGSYRRKNKENQLFYRGAYNSSPTTKRCIPNCGIISERQIVRALIKTFCHAVVNVDEVSLRKWLVTDEGGESFDEEAILKEEIIKLKKKRGRIIENFEDSLIDKKTRDSKFVVVNGEINRCKMKLVGIDSRRISEVDRERLIQKVIKSFGKVQAEVKKISDTGDEITDENAYSITENILKNDLLDRIDIDFKKKLLYIHTVGGRKLRQPMPNSNHIGLIMGLENNIIETNSL